MQAGDGPFVCFPNREVGGKVIHVVCVASRDHLMGRVCSLDYEDIVGLVNTTHDIRIF